MSRIVVVGGGVVGLSIANELARRGESVVVIERAEIGRRASWAGGGILVPANGESAIHPLEKLTAYSNQLHAEWASRLVKRTGIDNGFTECGAICVARTAGERAALAGMKLHWDEYQIRYSEINRARTAELAPGLSDSAMAGEIVYLPDESQIRNPDHLESLAAECRLDGVEIHDHQGDIQIQTRGDRIHLIATEKSEFEADHFCFAAGVWTDQILQQIGLSLPMVPVRGQMLLFKLPRQKFRPIVNEGVRYIVPRIDGHVLVGSTTEEAGFVAHTTEEKITELKSFAIRLFPELNDSTLVKVWAGLRPATFDGFPYMGRIASFKNAFVAAGHFKIGLQQSTGTAVVISDLIQGKQPFIDIAPFEPERLNEIKNT